MQHSKNGRSASAKIASHPHPVLRIQLLISIGDDVSYIRSRCRFGPVSKKLQLSCAYGIVLLTDDDICHGQGAEAEDTWCRLCSLIHLPIIVYISRHPALEEKIILKVNPQPVAYRWPDPDSITMLTSEVPRENLVVSGAELAVEAGGAFLQGQKWPLVLAISSHGQMR